MKKDAIGILFLYYFSTEAGFEQLGALWLQFGIFACFHGAFTVVMNNKRTLFGLFRSMAANPYQGINNMVKVVYIVIVQYDLIIKRNTFLY